jgi:hypothetical protein
MTWQTAAEHATSFSDVQVFGARVTSDGGQIDVTVTYFVVGFMERDPDLPTATYSTRWRWESSSWRVISPVSCSPTR